MKKILFVIPYLHKGGAERVVSNLTMNFPNDWDIDILINSDKYIDYPVRGNIISLGIDEKPRTGSVLFQFKVFVKRVMKLYKLKKENHYKACISHLDSANVANILSGKFQCRVIVTAHSSLVQQSRLPQYKYIVNPLVRLFYNRADQVVAVSSGIKEELHYYFGLRKNKVTVIENGCDLATMESQIGEPLSDEEAALFHGKRIIITTGRLTEAKGQWHLIRAFAKIHEKMTDTLLVILGVGTLENYLKDLAVRCGMKDSVYFAGFSDNPYKYIRRASVFVLSSMYEGFPCALAEAVCLGCPCVSTDFGSAAREILASESELTGEKVSGPTKVEYGVLTPVCSGRMYQSMDIPLEKQEEYLADAVSILLNDPEQCREYAAKSIEKRELLEIDRMIRLWVRVAGEKT